MNHLYGEMSIVRALWLQGLGKTVQVIAVLAYLVESQGMKEPSLIVCPSSVLSNWQAELQAWAPGLHVLLHLRGKHAWPNT